MANPKKKVGRPAIVDEIALQKLEQAFALGCSDREACVFAGIGCATLYNYQLKHPEFLERKELLKEKPVLLARQELVDGLKGNPELCLKFLERKRKDEFSTRSETTGADGQPVVVNITESQADRIRKAAKQ